MNFTLLYTAFFLFLLGPEKEVPYTTYTNEFTSDLPVILLNADTKIPVTDDTIVNMTVIYKGDTEYFKGKAEISLHGATSLGYKQNSMNLKSLNMDETNNKFPFFGFPKGKNWLLINHYNDRAIMRNALSYELFQQMGRYASRYQHCEVFLNNNYAGIYLFVEKITQDKDRVAISSLKEDDVSGDALTGGYIWKFDTYDGGYKIQYPSKSDIQPEQSNYLFTETLPSIFAPDSGKLWKANDTERAQMIDEDSWIDYFLLNELSANGDGFKKSRYFHKDRDDIDPRIHAGPVWDFDWAWKFIADAYPNVAFGWIHQRTDFCCSGHEFSYMSLLLSDTYRNKTIARYIQLRQTLFSRQHLYTLVDYFYTILKKSGAAKRHIDFYHIFDFPPIAPEAHEPTANFDDEIKSLKEYITTRLEFMDKTIDPSQELDFYEPPLSSDSSDYSSDSLDFKFNFSIIENNAPSLSALISLPLLVVFILF